MPLYSELYHNFVGNTPIIPTPIVSVGSSTYSPPTYVGVSRTFPNPLSSASSRTAPSSFTRGYVPKLTPITETPLTSTRIAALGRVSSPKFLAGHVHTHHHHHGHSSPTYQKPRRTINTADIDVSASKYAGSTRTQLSSLRGTSVLESGPPAPAVSHYTSASSSPINLTDGTLTALSTRDQELSERSEQRRARSTINRNRTVVRLNTIRARSKSRGSRGSTEGRENRHALADGPGASTGVASSSSSTEPTFDEEMLLLEPPRPGGGISSWRDNFRDELSLRPRIRTEPSKSPGELLLEKHLIREDECGGGLVVAPPASRSPVPKRRGTIRRKSAVKIPSFHEICADISSDKLDDDLNAGELRRRASQLIEDELLQFQEELKKAATAPATSVADTIEDRLQEALDQQISQDSGVEVAEKRKIKKIKRTRTKVLPVLPAPEQPDVQPDSGAPLEADVVVENAVPHARIVAELESIEECTVFKLPQKKKKVLANGGGTAASKQASTNAANKPTLANDGQAGPATDVPVIAKPAKTGIKTYVRKKTVEALPPIETPDISNAEVSEEAKEQVVNGKPVGVNVEVTKSQTPPEKHGPSNKEVAPVLEPSNDLKNAPKPMKLIDAKVDEKKLSASSDPKQSPEVIKLPAPVVSETAPKVASANQQPELKSTPKPTQLDGKVDEKNPGNTKSETAPEKQSPSDREEAPVVVQSNDLKNAAKPTKLTDGKVDEKKLRAPSDPEQPAEVIKLPAVSDTAQKVTTANQQPAPEQKLTSDANRSINQTKAQPPAPEEPRPLKPVPAPSVAKVGLRPKKPLELTKRSTDEVDFWSTIGTRETVSFARRKNQLVMLRTTEEEESPPDSPKSPISPKGQMSAAAPKPTSNAESAVMKAKAPAEPAAPISPKAKVPEPISPKALKPTITASAEISDAFAQPGKTASTPSALKETSKATSLSEPVTSKLKTSIDSSKTEKTTSSPGTLKEAASNSLSAKANAKAALPEPIAPKTSLDTITAKVTSTVSPPGAPTLQQAPSNTSAVEAKVAEPTSPNKALTSKSKTAIDTAGTGKPTEQSEVAPPKPKMVTGDATGSTAASSQATKSKTATVPEPTSPKPLNSESVTSKLKTPTDPAVKTATPPDTPTSKIAPTALKVKPQPLEPASKDKPITTPPETGVANKAKQTTAPPQPEPAGKGLTVTPLVPLDTKKLSPKELIKAIAPNIAAAAEKKLAQEKIKPAVQEAPKSPVVAVAPSTTTTTVEEPTKKVVVKKVVKVVKPKTPGAAKVKPKPEEEEQEQRRLAAQQQQQQQQQNLERMKTKLNQITLNMGVKGLEVEVKECQKCQTAIISDALPVAVAIVPTPTTTTATPKGPKVPIANGAKLTKNKFGTLDNLSDLSAVSVRDRHHTTISEAEQRGSEAAAAAAAAVAATVVKQNKQKQKPTVGAGAQKQQVFLSSSDEEEEEKKPDDKSKQRPVGVEVRAANDSASETSFSGVEDDWSSEEEEDDDDDMANDKPEKKKPFDPTKRVKLNFDQMRKCYSKEEKSPIVLVARPRPLWKVKRHGHRHNRKADLTSSSGSGSSSGSDDESTSTSTTTSSGATASTTDQTSSEAISTMDGATSDINTDSSVNSSTGGKKPKAGKKGQKGQKPDPFGDIYDNPMVIPLHAEPRTSSRKSGGSFVGPATRDENNNTPADLEEDERARSIGGGGHEVRSASTSSHDSGFYGGGTAPISPKKALETSYTYAQFQKTGKLTAPATVIPRFRKYNVDDFHFLTVLGKGSFGKVFLAELKNSDYYYAIKCLKKDVVLEDDDVDCTLIERKVLALGTKHPFLCHLFCTFQTDSHLFFVMEYLNGGDLMFHIQQSGRFPEARARFYAAEIVSGLKFLHRKGIVYRDLKLDNVLLDYDGHVRIADFGMCKLEIYLDKLADSFCGTPDYMAPEIIKGQKYNQAVDWWSFGVLVYEMLVGQSPFSGCDEDELFWSICNEIPWFPHYLSKEALRLLQSLLEKDASIRLGVLNTMDEESDIKYHPFFNSIIWDKLERRAVEPPFKPQVRHPLDTQYFDKQFTRERARLTPIDRNILASMDQAQFEGFTYTNPNNTLTQDNARLYMLLRTRHDMM